MGFEIHNVLWGFLHKITDNYRIVDIYGSLVCWVGNENSQSKPSYWQYCATSADFPAGQIVNQVFPVTDQDTFNDHENARDTPDNSDIMVHCTFYVYDD